MSREVLISCERISKAYGPQPLFEDLSLGLLEGDRVGLVGPNGSGKTTLVKILAGLESPDAGTRSAKKRLRVGYVEQDPSLPLDRTIHDVMVAAREQMGPDAFARSGIVEITLGRAGFDDPSGLVGSLSGGWRKRLAIARELVREPEVLLLDEPTNHLDVEGILWLEALLETEALAYLVVSHDRTFLEHVSRRVIEVNRALPGGLFATDGRYSDFLEKRDEALRGQASYQDSLANVVRREIDWLKHGPKAQTTKADYRVREAERKIEELRDLKERTTTRSAGIDFTHSERRTKKLLVADGVCKDLGGRRVLDGVDLELQPGMRIGLIGPNGSGKTTLLRVLRREIEPDAGSIDRATDLRVASFEQDRSTLDPTMTLRRALAPAGDDVEFRGRRIHVSAWARRFLFRPERLDTRVGVLSGGEQARIRIASLVRQPADLLVLDEPTNDLDIPTLEVLEESLAEFPGALVLVTHDRYLLDRVATEILALDGSGHAHRFTTFDQWLSARTASASAIRAAAPKPAKREATSAKRLSYKEQREREAIEAKIVEAEAAVARAEAAVADPAVASNAGVLHARYDALAVAQGEVERLYARWAELEAKQK